MLITRLLTVAVLVASLAPQTPAQNSNRRSRVAGSQLSPNKQTLLSRVLNQELYFFRKVCQPTDDQYASIRDAAIQRIREFQKGGGHVSIFEPELRHLVTRMLKKPIRKQLDSDTYEHYVEETAAREVLQRQGVAMLVATLIDREAYLNAEQFASIESELIKKWERDWPDAGSISGNRINAIIPGWGLLRKHLTPLQKEIHSYRGKQRNAQRSGEVRSEDLIHVELNPDGLAGSEATP